MCAIATMIFIPGSYSLYYGTEILTEGGFDPDSRRAFDWEKLQRDDIQEFWEGLKQVLALKRQPAIKNGKVKFYEQNGLFVIERYCDEQNLKLKVCKKSVRISADGALTFNVDKYFNDNSFVVEGEACMKKYGQLSWRRYLSCAHALL